MKHHQQSACADGLASSGRHDARFEDVSRSRGDGRDRARQAADGYHLPVWQVPAASAKCTPCQYSRQTT